MKRASMLLAAICLFSMIGCNKNPADSNAGFSSKLTLGTSMNGFNLVNEGTTFTRTGANATIYFRLESAADMAGSKVIITVEKNSSGSWSTYTSFTFENPQSYGHILLSNFSLSAAGSFRATGMLATGSVTVASKDFTVQ